MRRILIFILFLFYSKAALTQIELIKNLLLDTTTNSTFHIHTIKGISVEKITKEYSDKVLHEKYRYFIKRGKDLFAFIDGTGRLYKVSLLNNEIEFTRLDSTIHFGYNIASFAFCNQNKIYNIGGYGIWRTNGQLRVYNFKDKEWDIVKLNKEIPFMGDANLLYYNPTQNKIYIGFYNALNEAIKADEFAKEYVFDVMELDLKNNDWTKLGTLNTSLQNNLSQLRAISISPWGLLAELMGKFILLDYENNQI